MYFIILLVVIHAETRNFRALFVLLWILWLKTYKLKKKNQSKLSNDIFKTGNGKAKATGVRHFRNLRLREVTFCRSTDKRTDSLFYWY